MTISSVTSKVIYVGTGSTAAAAKIFAYPFKINSEQDLTVNDYNINTSTATLKVLTTDYAVSGVGVDTGGNVTLTGSYTNLPTSSWLVIQREVDLTQAVDYVENDAFPAETHEAALDKLCMTDQQLQEQIDRCIKVDIAQTSSSVAYTEFAAQAAIATSSATVSVAQASSAVVSAATATTQATASTSSATVSVAQAAAAASSAAVALSDTITNTGTGNALYIDQQATLASTNSALKVYSNVAQTSTSSALVDVKQASASSTEPVVEVSNYGVGSGMEVTTFAGAHGIYLNATSTPMLANNHGIYVVSNVATTAGNAALVKVNQSSDSATEPAIEVTNAGTGPAFEIGQNGSAANIRLTGKQVNLSPVDGDIWYQGTNLYIRLGGTTCTVNVSVAP